MPQVDICPRCGAARGGSLRLCPGCGLDYWELASREAPEGTVPRRQPSAGGHTGGGVSSVLLTVGGLLGVLAVCGFVLLAFLKIEMAPWSTASGSDPPAALEFPDVFASGNPLTGDATRVVDAFLAEIHAPDAAFHVATAATVETLSGPGGLRLTEATYHDDMDVVGDSFAGVTSATGPQAEDNRTIEIVYIDGEVWIRWEGDDYWMSGTYEQPFPVNPLSRLGRDVEYIGSETRDGQVIHQLRTRAWLAADVDDVVEFYDNVDITDRTSVTDIYVTDAGIPISRHTEMTVTVTDGLVRATVEITMDSTFSEWGAPITITPPN